MQAKQKEVQAEVMGLRRQRVITEEERTLMGFKLPKSYSDYLRSEAVRWKCSNTDVLLDAIQLDKFLTEKLVPHEEALRRLAYEHDMNLREHYEEVLVLAIQEALAAREKKNLAKK